MSNIAKTKTTNWVADAISLRIESEDHICDTESLYVVRLSASGLRLTYKNELQTGEILSVTMFLGPSFHQVNFNAKVISCKQCEEKLRGYSTHLAFEILDDSTKDTICTHIENIIEHTSVIKELPYPNAA